MHLPVFENAYFLQSLGWAILNSFWQAGILWLLYKAVTGINSATPAVYKLNGKQYIVIACGGGKSGLKSGDSYIAYALPD